MEMVNLNVKKKELETNRKNIMEGVKIRSRAQWIKEGEKCNKILLQSRKKALYFEANVSADKFLK